MSTYNEFVLDKLSYVHMQVITRRLTSPRAPSTPPQSEHAPDKVDEKTPGSLSSREESAGTPTAREERRKTERKRGKDREATGLKHPRQSLWDGLLFVAS